MKSSHSIQPFVPNKKLIIHFDVDSVLRINHPNKDLYVNISSYIRFMSYALNGYGENYKKPVNKILIKLLDGKLPSII